MRWSRTTGQGVAELSRALHLLILRRESSFYRTMRIKDLTIFEPVRKLVATSP